MQLDYSTIKMNSTSPQKDLILIGQTNKLPNLGHTYLLTGAHGVVQDPYFSSPGV